MKIRIFFVLLLMTLSANAIELKHIPVLDNGRMKPFDSMAREVLVLITGKKTYKNQDPSRTVVSWLFAPESWQNQSIFEIEKFWKVVDYLKRKR